MAVAEARLWVDVEMAVREWARDHVTSVERRVFFAANNAVEDAQVVLTRIGGPDDDCLIQFDVWASKKATAAALASELATAVDMLARYEFEGVLLHGASVDSVRWVPDPESNKPRYIVDVTFTATAGRPES